MLKWMWRRGTLLHCWWECELVQSLWKTVWRFLKELKIELSYDPEIALLGIYLKDIDAPEWLNQLSIQLLILAQVMHDLRVMRWSPMSGSSLSRVCLRFFLPGIPGWCSGLAPAFGPGRDPGDPGSNPTSGSRCMEPASPSACVSASLSLCDYHK